jgi:hypothetical protein
MLTFRSPYLKDFERSLRTATSVDLMFKAIEAECKGYMNKRQKLKEDLVNADLSEQKKQRLSQILSESPQRLMATTPMLAGPKFPEPGESFGILLTLMGDNGVRYVTGSFSVYCGFDRIVQLISPIYESCRGNVSHLKDYSIDVQDPEIEDDLEVFGNRFDSVFSVLGDAGVELMRHAHNTTPGEGYGIFNTESEDDSSSSRKRSKRRSYSSSAVDSVYGVTDGKRSSESEYRTSVDSSSSDDAKKIVNLLYGYPNRPNYAPLLRAGRNSTTIWPPFARLLVSTYKGEKKKDPDADAADIWDTVTERAIKQGIIRHHCEVFNKKIDVNRDGICVLAGSCPKFSEERGSDECKHQEIKPKD